MKNTKYRNSETYSLKLLIFAVVISSFTIVTLIFAISHNGNSISDFFFFISIILTIVSLILAIFSFKKQARTLNVRNIFPFNLPLRNFRKLAFLSQVVQTTNILLILLAIFAILGLGSFLFGYFNYLPPLTIVGGLIFLLTILLAMTSYKLIQEKAEPLLSAPISTEVIRASNMDEFLILRKEIVYEYLSDGITMLQRKKLRIQSLKSGITHFIDKYRWTGSGQCSIKVLTPDFIISDQREEGVTPWNFFEVKFPHSLKKSEVVDFIIEWELVDEKRSGVPFLSATIDTETKYLSLMVILPDKLKPSRAYSYEFANYIDAVPIETNEITWNQTTKSLDFEVSLPKKYHRYLIRWYNE